MTQIEVLQRELNGARRLAEDAQRYRDPTWPIYNLRAHAVWQRLERAKQAVH